jgi:hypothetical protein
MALGKREDTGNGRRKHYVESSPGRGYGFVVR